MPSEQLGRSTSRPDPVEVLHSDAHAGHECYFTDVTCCPYYDEALDILDVLTKAGYRVASGPEPWCPECFEAPEPLGPWAPPGDRCADEHVLPWLDARKTTPARGQS